MVEPLLRGGGWHVTELTFNFRDVFDRHRYSTGKQHFFKTFMDVQQFVREFYKVDEKQFSTD